MATIGIYIADISINGGGVTKFAINLARALKPYHKCIVISDYSREKKFHKGYEKIESIVLNQDSEKEKIKKLSLVCKENNIDLIISNEIYLNRRCVAINIFSIKKIPYITVTHMRSELWFKETKNLLINILKKSIIKLGFNKAKYNIAVSKGLANELKLEKFCKNPINIYNPIIDEEILKYRKEYNESNISNKDIYEICVCGWISEVKNYETAIRAVDLIKDKINIRLNIIGGYSDKYKDYCIKMTELIKELNIEDNIKFWGTVDNPYSIMQQMDALILTSKIEAFGNVLVEGMGIGLPIISSDCKYGPKEILCNGEYGYLFSVDDYQTLSNQIIEIFNNREKYIYYMEKSKERAKIFTFNMIANQYKDIISKINN